MERCQFVFLILHFEAAFNAHGSSRRLSIIAQAYIRVREHIENAEGIVVIVDHGWAVAEVERIIRLISSIMQY